MYATELQIDERIGGTFQCSFRAPAVASEAGEQGKCIDRCNHRIQVFDKRIEKQISRYLESK